MRLSVAPTGYGRAVAIDLRATLRDLVRAVLRAMRERDLALHAAAVTFYGGIALVPAAVLTIRLAALLAGPERVSDLAGGPVGAVPGALGADRAAGALVRAGVSLGWIQALVALVPATLYGEGLRRAFASLSRPPDQPREPVRGWQGRLLVLPLFAAGPGLLLVLLLVLPVAAALLERGGWTGFGGVVVSFLTVWVVLSALLTWVYRIVGPARPEWVACSVGATLTAANLSGFAHGFVLFWAIPVDLGYPFGGFDVVGAVVAVALWLYLLHSIALIGYVATTRTYADLHGVG